MNLPPKTLTISQWLHQASQQLADVKITSHKLDAEIILAHTLRKSRTFLHAHGDESIDHRHFDIAETRLQLRLERTPLAYIVGHKEFYGRLFKVTPATLVPRPESEAIIDLLKDIVAHPLPIGDSPQQLVDVGTGTGCLGITAKLELPQFNVTLADISRHALQVAKTNAALLHANVILLESNLLENYPFTADIIIANLPYVDHAWEVSPETKFEPTQALYAEDNGLHLIKKLLAQTKTHLQPHGHILLEADPRQHQAIIGFAKQSGLKKQTIRDFIIHLQKI